MTWSQKHEENKAHVSHTRENVLFRFWLPVRISLSINLFQRRNCLLNVNQLVNEHKDQNQQNTDGIGGGDQQCKASENLQHMSKQILTPDSSFTDTYWGSFIFYHTEKPSMSFSVTLDGLAEIAR